MARCLLHKMLSIHVHYTFYKVATQMQAYPTRILRQLILKIMFVLKWIPHMNHSKCSLPSQTLVTNQQHSENFYTNHLIFRLKFHQSPLFPHDLSNYIPCLYPHWKRVAKTRHSGFRETLLFSSPLYHVPS